jgi:shikimate kinase
MRIALVGMSGSGKSFWSKRLSRSSFRCFCCDDLIAARLFPQARKRDGSIAAVGRWMGFPFEPPYKEHEAAYLACEMAVMAELLDTFGSRGEGLAEDIVVDTTGSVIYTGEETLMKLRRHTTVVHLATPLEIQKKMLEAYVKQPRPVLWRDRFIRRPDETNAQAMARCYPELLASREGQYEKLAHVTISYYRHRRAGFSVEEFLHDVKTGRG